MALSLWRCSFCGSHMVMVLSIFQRTSQTTVCAFGAGIFLHYRPYHTRISTRHRTTRYVRTYIVTYSSSMYSSYWYLLLLVISEYRRASHICWTRWRVPYRLNAVRLVPHILDTAESSIVWIPQSRASIGYRGEPRIV